LPKYVDAIEQNALSRQVSSLIGASSTDGGGRWRRFRGLLL